MNITRLLTTILGLPIVVIVLVLGNKYVIDIFFSIVAIISIFILVNKLCINNKITIVGKNNPTHVISKLGITCINAIEIENI